MSDIMRPIPFGRLMDWILTEYLSLIHISEPTRH